MDATARTSSEKHPQLTIGNCAAPRREQFRSDLEFERAKVLRTAHIAEYQKQVSALEDVKARANEKLVNDGPPSGTRKRDARRNGSRWSAIRRTRMRANKTPEHKKIRYCA